ncbi:MAG: glycoside hydrolase family 32 protein [Saprospiraceae bacterium]
MKYLTILLILCGLLFACKSTKPPTTSQANYYQEPHRPQFHFSPEQHWMNDPNGLVYLDGEYHLFYQYYPGGTKWGPMHWGHAVSRDLLHWQHLPIALYPDPLGYIFSGSAVVDIQNTAGFKTGKTDPIVAIFTYHDIAGEKAGRQDFQYQGIAYSNDRGRTWTKYAGNPVIPNPGAKDFRDPKVFWHAATQRWVLILAQGDHTVLYTSPDLKKWTKASEFGKDYGSTGRPWECPDLFELPVAGTTEKRWVLLVSLGDGAPNGGSGTEYFIGQFDGTTFTSDNPPATTLWLDYGRDNYAGVSWNNSPGDRRLFIGWMSNWQYAQEVPTTPWRSAMTIPRTLQLKKIGTGIRLVQEPVQELKKLRGKGINLTKGKNYTLSATGNDLEVAFQWSENRHNTVCGLTLFNAKNERLIIGYDAAMQQVYVDRRGAGKADFSTLFTGKHVAPYSPTGQTIHLRVLLDRASVELFVDDGAVTMTENFFPKEEFTTLQVMGESAAIQYGKIYPLRSVWR